MPTANDRETTIVWLDRLTKDGDHQLVIRDLVSGIDVEVGLPQPTQFMLEPIAEEWERQNLGPPRPDREP